MMGTMENENCPVAGTSALQAAGSNVSMQDLPDFVREEEAIRVLYRNSQFMQFAVDSNASTGMCCEELKSILGMRKRFPGAHHVVWLVRFLLDAGMYDSRMYLKGKVSDNISITYTLGFVHDRAKDIRVCMEPENTDGNSVVHCGVFADIAPFPLKAVRGISDGERTGD